MTSPNTWNATACPSSTRAGASLALPSPPRWNAIAIKLRSLPGHPASTDGDAALRAPASQAGRADAEMRPHVELDLLGQPQLVVEQSRQPVAGPGPGLDLESQRVAVGLGAELDLARFQVTVQRREPEARLVPADHADGPVPRARHADNELIALPHGALGAAGLPEHGHLRGSLVEPGRYQVDQCRRGHAGPGDPHPVQAVQQRAHARVKRLQPVREAARGVREAGQVRARARFL